jgi:hypothetical protein
MTPPDTTPPERAWSDGAWMDSSGIEASDAPQAWTKSVAEALTALGHADEARPHLERFVQKSGKRARYLSEARRRLEGGA